MANSDGALKKFVLAIIAGDTDSVLGQLTALPELARAQFEKGATRQEAQEFFLQSVGRYIVAGDTALHIAAAAHRTDMARALVRAGANVHTGNRFGDQPLHIAARGNPNSERWNPEAQSATITALVEAGGDPDFAFKYALSSIEQNSSDSTKIIPQQSPLLEHEPQSAAPVLPATQSTMHPR